MTRIVAVLVALLVAVHVSVPILGMPAPLPAFFVVGAVITWQCRMIWHAAGWSRLRWTAGS